MPFQDALLLEFPARLLGDCVPIDAIEITGLPGDLGQYRLAFHIIMGRLLDSSAAFSAFPNAPRDPFVAAFNCLRATPMF